MFKKLLSLFKRGAQSVGVTTGLVFPTSHFKGICDGRTTTVKQYPDVTFYVADCGCGCGTCAVGYRVRNHSKQLLVFNGSRVSTMALGNKVPKARVHEVIKSLTCKG